MPHQPDESSARRKHHENARRTEEDVREVVLDDAEARRVDLEGLLPFTRYSVSVQVVNPEGVGPTATCTVSTDEGGSGCERRAFGSPGLPVSRSA